MKKDFTLQKKEGEKGRMGEGEKGRRGEGEKGRRGERESGRIKTQRPED